MMKLIVALRNFAHASKKLTSQNILLPKKEELALLYTNSALLRVITISQDFITLSPAVHSSSRIISLTNFNAQFFIQ